MYRIIGGDGQEYGPVSAEQVRQWIGQGRLNADSQIKEEAAADWQSLSALAEFAGDLGAQTPPVFAVPLAASAEPAAEDDYELNITGCLSGGWELFKEHFSLLFATTLVYAAIVLALGLLGAIPVIGPIFSIVSMVIGGPLMAGVYYVFIQTQRGQPSAVGDLFTGFRENFGQLFLGQLVTSLLVGLCIAPAGIVFAVGMIPAAVHKTAPSTGFIVAFVVLLLVGLVPMIFLTVNWLFTLPLIIDRRMEFWPAMQTSWRQVSRHWWSVFGLVVLCGLVYVAGALACLVGALFTAPIAIGALVLAYETLFRSDRLSAP